MHENIRVGFPKLSDEVFEEKFTLSFLIRNNDCNWAVKTHSRGFKNLACGGKSKNNFNSSLTWIALVTFHPACHSVIWSGFGTSCWVGNFTGSGGPSSSELRHNSPLFTIRPLSISSWVAGWAELGAPGLRDVYELATSSSLKSNLVKPWLLPLRILDRGRKERKDFMFLVLWKTQVSEMEQGVVGFGHQWSKVLTVWGPHKLNRMSALASRMKLLS